MLKSIDILISLSVVMLVASMAVTVMTGFINHLRNARGKHLLQGITDLLRLMDPDLTQKAVDTIGATVLTHPLIRDAKGRMGAVIHREELTKLLMELAVGDGPHRLDDGTQARLRQTLSTHGIPNPQATLEKIRALTLRLEKSNPELSNMARSNLAILHEAESRFIGKINSWFDPTMDRVSQRFTASARATTFFCGLILAVSLQLDSVALVNRISVDDALRQSLVNQAQKISNEAPADSTYSRDLYGPVIDQGVISVPKYPEDFERFADVRHLIGILFSTLLLSLGAPFWYNALNKFLQLRSKLAQNDDIQRKERQSTQEVIHTPAGPAQADSVVLNGGQAEA